MFFCQKSKVKRLHRTKSRREAAYLVAFDLSYHKNAGGLKLSDVQWRTRRGKRLVRSQASHKRIPEKTANKPGRKPLLSWLISRRKPQPRMVDRPKQEPTLDLQSLSSHSAEISGLQHLETKLKGFLSSPDPDYSEVAEDIHRLHNLFPDSEEYIEKYFSARHEEGEHQFRAGFGKALMLLEQGKEGQCRKLFKRLQAEMDKDLFTGMNPDKVDMVNFLEGRLMQIGAERRQRSGVSGSGEANPEIFVSEPESVDFSGTPDEIRGRARILVDQEDFSGAEKLLNHLISMPLEKDNDRRSSHVLNAYRMGKQAQSGKFLGTASATALREHRELLLDYKRRGYWFDVQTEGLEKLEKVIGGLLPEPKRSPQSGDSD